MTTTTVLNSVINIGYGEDGRRFVQMEPDARHAELIVQALGLSMVTGVQHCM